MTRFQWENLGQSKDDVVVNCGLEEGGPPRYLEQRLAAANIGGWMYITVESSITCRRCLICQLGREGSACTEVLLEDCARLLQATVAGRSCFRVIIQKNHWTVRVFKRRGQNFVCAFGLRRQQQRRSLVHDISLLRLNSFEERVSCWC